MDQTPINIEYITEIEKCNKDKIILKLNAHNQITCLKDTIERLKKQFIKQITFQVT